MQPDATAAAPATGTGGGGPPPGGCAAGASSQMLVLVMMFGIFYFMLIRPQQKKQRELDTLLKGLRKGDKVRTTGGIRGEIMDLTDTEVTLRIDEKVKINILRSHVAGKVPKPSEEPAKGNG